MKPTKQLRRVAPAPRARGGRTAPQFAGHALPVAAALMFVVSALVVGGTFAAVVAALPPSVPTLLAGWVAAVGLTFALPLVVVRGVIAVVERLQ